MQQFVINVKVENLELKIGNGQAKGKKKNIKNT